MPGLRGVLPSALSCVGPDPGALSQVPCVMKQQSSASEQGGPSLRLPLRAGQVAGVRTGEPPAIPPTSNVRVPPQYLDSFFLFSTARLSLQISVADNRTGWQGAGF